MANDDLAGRGPATLVDVPADPEHARRLRRMRAFIEWLTDLNESATDRAMDYLGRCDAKTVEMIEHHVLGQVNGKVGLRRAAFGIQHNSGGGVKVDLAW